MEFDLSFIESDTPGMVLWYRQLYGLGLASGISSYSCVEVTYTHDNWCSNVDRLAQERRNFEGER